MSSFHDSHSCPAPTYRHTSCYYCRLQLQDYTLHDSVENDVRRRHTAIIQSILVATAPILRTGTVKMSAIPSERQRSHASEILVRRQLRVVHDPPNAVLHLLGLEHLKPTWRPRLNTKHRSSRKQNCEDLPPNTPTGIPANLIEVYVDGLSILPLINRGATV